VNRKLLRAAAYFLYAVFMLAAVGCEQAAGSDANEHEDSLYSIAVDPALRLGSINLSLSKAAAGTTVGVTVEPNSGYDIVGESLAYSDWDGGNATVVQGNEDTLEYEFVMPAANIFVTAQFERESNNPYEIHIVQAPGGTISASAQSAKRRSIITLTVVPEENRQLKYGTLKHNDNVIEATGTETYSFAMPKADVTVTAEFKGYNVITGEGQMSMIGTEDWRLHEIYTLGNDIALSAWIPVGTPDDPFTGTFYGNGHAITIKSFSPDTAVFGIFGTARNARIADLNILVDNLNILFSGSAIVINAGFAAQSVSNSILQNITVGGAASITRTAAGNLIAGGVVGSAQNGSRILDCASSLDITASAEGIVITGGIAAAINTNSVIDNSYATGDIIVAKAMGHNVSAGGLLGSARTYATVSNSGASGNVSALADNTGATSMDNLYMIYVGGLAGYSGQSVIRNCSASGDVCAKSPYPYAGGVVGYNYQGSLLEQSYATGTITAESIGNLSYAGGVAGYNSNRDSIVSTVQDCYAEGNVLAKSTASSAWAGGVVGSNANSGAVLRCYATGAVQAESGSSIGDFGDQPGASIAANAGGIAGYVYYNSATYAYIQNCAALNSSVTANKIVASFNVNARRVAGLNDDYGYCKNNIACVSSISAGGSAVTPNPDADGLDGADCAAQPAQSVYTETLGWDFSTVWKMGGEGYPILQWQQ
jgi:hypothetical protein